MTVFAIAILLVGVIFIASRVVRLVHLSDVLRSSSPDQQSAEAELRARALAEGGPAGEEDDARVVGIALALALREAEAEARGHDVDSPL
jgi:hypothetical protein